MRALRSKLQVAGYLSTIAIVIFGINTSYYFLGEPSKSKIYQYQGYIEFLASDYRGPMDYFCGFLKPVFSGGDVATVATANWGIAALAACLGDSSLVDRRTPHPEFVIPRPSRYPVLEQVASEISKSEMQYQGEYQLDLDYVRVNFPVIDFGFNSNLIGVPGSDQLADCSTDLPACARLYVRRNVYDKWYRTP